MNVLCHSYTLGGSYTIDANLPNVRVYARDNHLSVCVRQRGMLYYADCGTMQGYGQTMYRALRALDEVCAGLADSVAQAA